jgi:hypothetical protein
VASSAGAACDHYGRGAQAAYRPSLRLRGVSPQSERRRQGRLLRRLSPEQRFENHKNGIKAARVVRKFGERLVPKLYAHLNPMPYKKAQFMETALAESLRKRGFTVFGGH